MIDLSSAVNTSSTFFPSSNFTVISLSRKDTVPLFNKGPDNSSHFTGQHGEKHLNTLDALDPGKYVGVLVTLDIMCFMMIIFLAVSANKAYKFMASKDRILLFHFIFLEVSLFCKTLSLLCGAMYYSMGDHQPHTWVQFYIFIENLGFVAFYIACSLNLYKWILLLNRIDFYVNKQTMEQFNDKRKVQFWIFMSVVAIITVIELVIIAIDSSIQDDYEALVIDRFLNMIYSLNGICLGVAFIIVGFKLLRKLNHHYEDIYEDKKTSIKFGIIIVFLSLVLISARFIYQEVFAEYFTNLKYQALLNNTWGYPIYEFCVVFFFEFTPILALICLIRTAVKKSWNELIECPESNQNQEGKRNNKSGVTALRKSQALLTDDESLFSSNSEALIKQDDNQNFTNLLAQRDHYMSTDFAFNQQQMFLVDTSNKERQTLLRKELLSHSEESQASSANFDSQGSSIGSHESQNHV